MFRICVELRLMLQHFPRKLSISSSGSLYLGDFATVVSEATVIFPVSFRKLVLPVNSQPYGVEYIFTPLITFSLNFLGNFSDVWRA